MRARRRTPATPTPRSPTWIRRPSPSAASHCVTAVLRRRRRRADRARPQAAVLLFGDGGGFFPGCTSTTVPRRRCSPSSILGRRSTASSTTIPPRCASGSRCSPMRWAPSHRATHRPGWRACSPAAPPTPRQNATRLDPRSPTWRHGFPATSSAIAIADRQAAKDALAVLRVRSDPRPIRRPLGVSGYTGSGRPGLKPVRLAGRTVVIDGHESA
jgi:hypothetical protein